MLVVPPTEPHNPFDSRSGTLSTAHRASHGHVSANRTNTARPPFSPSPRQAPERPSCPVPSQRIAAQTAPVPPDRAIPQAPPTSLPHRNRASPFHTPYPKSLSDATPSIDGDKFRMLRFICQSQSLKLLFSSNHTKSPLFAAKACQLVAILATDSVFIAKVDKNHITLASNTECRGNLAVSTCCGDSHCYVLRRIDHPATKQTSFRRNDLQAVFIEDSIDLKPFVLSNGA